MRQRLTTLILPSGSSEYSAVDPVHPAEVHPRPVGELDRLDVSQSQVAGHGLRQPVLAHGLLRIERYLVYQAGDGPERSSVGGHANLHAAGQEDLCPTVLQESHLDARDGTGLPQIHHRLEVHAACELKNGRGVERIEVGRR